VSSDVAVVRLNANGSLDTGFDYDGKKTIDRGGTDEALGALLQPDGRIVLAGTDFNTGELVVTRLNPDGSPDLGFDGNGSVAIGFADGATNVGRAVALQAGGKLVVAGDVNYHDFALARLRPDGSLDAGFSLDGRQTVDFGSHDFSTAVAVQPDGRILVVGQSFAGTALAIARLEGDPIVQRVEPSPAPVTNTPPPPAADAPPAPPAFGASPLVTLELGAAARGPVKVRLVNRNAFAVGGTLAGRTTQAVRVGRRKRRIALKHVGVVVAPAASRTVSLRLPATLSRLPARRGGLRLRLTVSLRDPAGNTRTVSKTITVKRRAR
jgi:uncharacterized delta-60 repeat protein